MSTKAPTTPSPQISAGTALGPVRLVVSDVDRQRSFYRDAIGLSQVWESDGGVSLGASAGVPLVDLRPLPGAPSRPGHSTGLFHQALLVPDRPALARAIRRVLDTGWQFTGASDHLVSEAMYLDDPEGNGIEIYRDRPREEWPRVGGTIQMATEPMDLEGVMSELPAGSDAGMDAATTIGHVHLSVAELDAAERFYSGLLGFDVTVRGYPGALFVSAGGYHHHLGLNTWRSRGGPRAPAGARGLDHFTVRLAAPGELEQVAGRLDAAGVAVEPVAGGLLAGDPSGIRVRLLPAA